MGVLLIAMIAMVYLYFSNLNLSTQANDLSLNTVSAHSGVVFSFDHEKSFYEILKDQDLFQHILGKTKSNQLASLKEEFIEQWALAKFLERQKIYVGFLAGENSQIDYLICTQLKQSLDLEQLLTAHVPKNIKTSQLKDIVKLSFSDSSFIYLGLKDRLLILSNASEQVEKVMNGETPKTSDFANYIKDISGFTKNNLANLYLNFDALPTLFKNILNGPINGELSILNEKGAYATLNYNFSREKLLFNGSTMLDNPNSYYTLFNHLTDQKIFINNLLPEKTANYTIYAISDYTDWLTGLSKWLGTQRGAAQILKNEENISKKYGLALKQIFPTYFKNQFLTFQLASGEKFGGIALSNGEKVGQALLDLSSEYAPDIRIFRERDIP